MSLKYYYHYNHLLYIIKLGNWQKKIINPYIYKILQKKDITKYVSPLKV